MWTAETLGEEYAMKDFNPLRETKSGKILVSACLAGIPCRMDGQAKLIPEIKKLVDEGQAIPVCPEVEGGLSTPRSPSERQGHYVINQAGEDVTAQFILGAKRCMAVCQEHGCTKEILKSKSPSCGRGKIYDGSILGSGPIRPQNE